ncbi:MAG: RNA polymerase sigma factor, partial [Kiritimatiellae bacterium]|nr:RNA polymerase sigma factor [Kiritimatiellia bacterium]
MDIISEIRNAPEDGAKRLEREYKERLMAVAMNICGDKSEAEALAYDTMGKAVSQIESLSKPESLLSWMCSILVNTHSKATRRMSSEKVVYTDNLPDQTEETDGAESVFKSVDGALLRDAIAELPEKLREAVILRYFMDMPLTQMARFLTIPVGTVNSRLHLARKALVARLNPTAKKACAVALVALALLGATAALWVGGAFDGGERGAETTGTTKTTETSETVPEASVVPEVPESSASQSRSEEKEAKNMNIKATTAVVAAALVFPSAYGGVQATGGTEKYFFEGYMVHTFTNSGTFTVTHGGRVEVLVVGGGGGGGFGQHGAGGGGGGGVVTQE